MADIRSMSISLDAGRPSPEVTEWDLPAWGHPISQGVMPLFIAVADNFIPIGSAFTIGRGLPFVVTAAHNVHEAIKHEPRLQRYVTGDDFPQSLDLKTVGLFVLHQTLVASGEMRLAFWPLETIDAGRPTDVVIGFPQFQTQFPTLSAPISFDLPALDETMRSVGYTNFQFPAGGIPRSAVEANSFDWLRDYSHQLKVTAGNVERIFIRRFASGYVKGPCFTFGGEAFHGQSGGPVFGSSGVIRGVTSAAATTFFAKPTTIASLFYPLLLMDLRFGASMGKMRINSVRTFADLVFSGTIASDGTEQNVHLIPAGDGGTPLVGARALKSMSNFIHDDFDGFQTGAIARTVDGELYCLRPMQDLLGDV